MNCVYNYMQCVWTLQLAWVYIFLCANRCVWILTKMLVCEDIVCVCVWSCLVMSCMEVFLWYFSAGVHLYMCVLCCIIICMCVSMCVSPLPRWLCSEVGASEICCQRWILIRDHCHIYSTHTYTHAQAHVVHLQSHTPPLPHGRTTNSHSHYVPSVLIFSDFAGHSYNTDYQTVRLSHLKTDTW